MSMCVLVTIAMRPIPHTHDTERGEAGERTRLTSRRTTSDPEPDDDETWLAVQEF